MVPAVGLLIVKYSGEPLAGRGKISWNCRVAWPTAMSGQVSQNNKNKYLPADGQNPSW
jgi:hypothetical protein